MKGNLGIPFLSPEAIAEIRQIMNDNALDPNSLFDLKVAIMTYKWRHGHSVIPPDWRKNLGPRKS